jgi:hypothetical protein
MLTKQSRIATGVLTLGLIVGVAGPAAATTRQTNCTYSGSLVKVVRSFNTFVYDATYTRTTISSINSDKAMRSYSMTQFDNTGASGGGTGVISAGGATSAERKYYWSNQRRDRKPYLRIVVTATDGQTCTIRASIVP